MPLARESQFCSQPLLGGAQELKLQNALSSKSTKASDGQLQSMNSFSSVGKPKFFSAINKENSKSDICINIGKTNSNSLIAKPSKSTNAEESSNLNKKTISSLIESNKKMGPIGVSIDNYFRENNQKELTVLQQQHQHNSFQIKDYTSEQPKDQNLRYNSSKIIAKTKDSLYKNQKPNLRNEGNDFKKEILLNNNNNHHNHPSSFKDIHSISGLKNSVIELKQKSNNASIKKRDENFGAYPFQADLEKFHRAGLELVQDDERFFFEEPRDNYSTNTLTEQEYGRLEWESRKSSISKA